MVDRRTWIDRRRPVPLEKGYSCSKESFISTLPAKQANKNCVTAEVRRLQRLQMRLLWLVYVAVVFCYWDYCGMRPEWREERDLCWMTLFMTVLPAKQIISS